MKTYVLDSSALMTFFENRPGADTVEKLLTAAGNAQAQLAMSVVNWGEVYHAVWRAHGEMLANTKIQEISQLSVEIIEPDLKFTKAAARLKAQYNLPYADCFAAALAQKQKATLVTSDHDFDRVTTVIKILFL